MVLVAAFTLRALKNRSLPMIAVTVRRRQLLCLTNPQPWAEKLGAGLLIFATLAIGLYPKLIFDRVLPAVESMRFLQR